MPDLTTSQTTQHDHDDHGKPPHEIEIHVDRKRFRVGESTMTGAEIRALAGLGTEVDLYLEEHGDRDDRLIHDGERVKLRDEMHFFSVPRHVTPGHA